MASIRDVEIARKQREQGFEPNHQPTWGVIAEVNGSTSPVNEPNLTWVDEFNRSSTRKKYLNPTTLKTAGAVVELGPDTQPPYRKIIGTWTKGLSPGSTVPLDQFNTPNHAPNHQYPSESGVGEDAVKIWQPAWQPLKTTGNGQNLTVETQPLNYTVEGARKVFPGDSIDLTSYRPGLGLIRRILLYLDTNTNTIKISQGTAVTNNGAIPIPYPVVPSGMRGSAWIKLANGQTAVTTATHIDDARDTADSANSGRFVRKTGDTMTGPLTIDGSEDTPQLTIQGNGTQTANILLIEQSGGTDLLTLSNAGQMALPIQGVNGGLVLGGDVQLYRSAANILTIPDSTIIDGVADTVQLTIQGHSTQTNFVLLAETSAGTDLLTLSNAGQLNLSITGNGAGLKLASEIQLYHFGTGTLAYRGSSANAAMYFSATGTPGTAEMRFYDNDFGTLRGRFLYPATNPAGHKYFGFVNDGADYLAFFTANNTDMIFHPNNVEAFRLTKEGNATIGTAALATNATNGFLYIPTCAGVPSGTPTAYTGRVPMIFDTTNNNFYIYDGSWIKVTLA